MFSNRRRRTSGLALLVAAGLGLSVGACGPKKVPNSASLSLGGADAGCLAKAGPAINRYLNGTSTEAELGTTWNCVIHSLQLFEDRTRGASQGVYSPQELRAFLERYFLDDLRISDQLLTEAMELKRTVIGGRADILTHADLSRALVLFGKLREQTIKLRPYMPLTPTSAEQRGQIFAESAAGALRDAAGAVGAFFEDTGVPYTFAHFDILIGELKVLAGASPPAILQLLRDHIAAIQAAKGMLVAPEGDRIAGNEWSLTLTVAAQWYGLLLKAEAFQARYDSWMLGPGREKLAPLVREAFGLVDQALLRHPRDELSFEQLDALVASVLPQGLTVLGDRNVPVAHIQTFLRPLILRIMGGSDTGPSGRAAPGLTRAAWAKLLSRFEHWNDGQIYLERLFDTAVARAGGDVSLKSSGLLPVQLQNLEEQSEFAKRDADAVNRLRQVIANDRALFPGDSGQIYFNGYKTDRRLSLHDLSEANWMYELSRLLTAGYAEDPKRSQAIDDSSQSVTFDEFKSFVKDINDIGVDVKYIDAKDPLLAEKRFREGELFTFAGTGSTLLSARQTSQLLALMFSGKRLANQIHQEIIDSGCRTGEMDPFEYLLIDTPCYRSYFFGHIDHFWVNMPRLAAYYHTLSGARREQFEHAMEDGARKAGYSDGQMNSSDSEGFGMIGQYVEVVFSRFDHDDSGTLDWNEAREAFPVFKGSLHDISCLQGHCLNSDADLWAVFTYMLGHGKAPSTAAFVRWRYLPFFRTLAADRGMLMQIFGMLGKPAPGASNSE